MRAARSVRVLLALALLAGCWGLAGAEVSTDGYNQRPLSTLLMDLVVGITDGADPIPQLRWNPYRKIHRNRILNPDGAIRHDGRPDLAFHPVAGWPFAVWAWNNGNEHDIAFSRWQGDRWSETEFLTFDARDHVDPRVFVSNHGTVHAVWAVRGNDPQILVSARHLGAAEWSTPRRLTMPGEVVGRPSIAATENVAWIAYERVANNDGTPTPFVVVRRLDDHDVAPQVQVFPAEGRDAMDPVIHVNSGRVWMDWKFADDRMAWTILDGPGAGEAGAVPWTDPSWLGVEDARSRVREIVMGGRRSIDPDGTNSIAP